VVVEIAPPGGDFIREIGSVELLSLVQPNGILGRTGLRSRKALALFVVLVLSGGALVFTAGEARGQQHPAPEMPATVTGPERTPISDAELAGLATATLPADSPPSQVDERDAWSSSSPEPDLVMPGAPEPALALLEELYSTSWPDLLPEAAMPESFGVTFRQGPAYDPAVAMLDPGPVPAMGYPVPFVDPPPAPGSVGFGPALSYPGAPEPARGLITPEENEPPSSRVEEKPLVLSPTGTPEGVRPAPREGNGVVGPLSSVADREAPQSGVPLQEPLMPTPPVTDPSREAAHLLSSLEAAAGSTVETLHGAAVDVSEALAPGGEAPAELPSGGGTKAPSEDAPPPLSPAPGGGSYFSPSVGGQVGLGVVVPLLICILAAGFILLRPLVGRLWWASCELPKPSSVLLLPLERPG
jgi:hypothetical protein